MPTKRSTAEEINELSKMAIENDVFIITTVQNPTNIVTYESLAELSKMIKSDLEQQMPYYVEQKTPFWRCNTTADPLSKTVKRDDVEQNTFEEEYRWAVNNPKDPDAKAFVGLDWSNEDVHKKAIPIASKIKAKIYEQLI
jgi:hypothetical protein